MGHQDTKLTSMRPRLKELNDNPYIMVTIWLTIVVEGYQPQDFGFFAAERN